MKWNRNTIFFLILWIGFSMHRCSTEIADDQERALLYSLLIANPSEENYQSIVEINLRDVASYEGKCMDSFLGITAGAYLNVQYPPESRDFPLRKVAASEKSCAGLGFKGGVVNRIDGQSVSFKSYTCNPMGKLCDKDALKLVGYSTE